MILLVDNYDSFVYNLSRYVNELGCPTMVVRNDAISVGEVRDIGASHIILSPGPCTPADAGISTEVVRQLGATTPVLGVCLGHQCIGEAYGGRTVRALRPMHGKTAAVFHDGRGVLAGVPHPFMASRYHSLVIDPHATPPELLVTARSEQGEIMAVQHTGYPVFGVQFHPESVATEWGYLILSNFLATGAMGVEAGAAMCATTPGADLGRSATRVAQ
jgi:anthranilate synthase/aminodeoxychorismate synthase-like glutamine amidotransferase